MADVKAGDVVWYFWEEGCPPRKGEVTEVGPLLVDIRDSADGESGGWYGEGVVACGSGVEKSAVFATELEAMLAYGRRLLKDLNETGEKVVGVMGRLAELGRAEGGGR